MKKINETGNVVMFESEDGKRFANAVRNVNNGRYFKVIVKSESGEIKTIATRCDYNTAECLIREFLTK